MVISVDSSNNALVFFPPNSPVWMFSCVEPTGITEWRLVATIQRITSDPERIRSKKLQLAKVVFI